MKKLILLSLLVFLSNDLFAHTGHNHSFIHFELLYFVIAIIGVIIFKDTYLRTIKLRKNIRK
mgnify:CR=1 FL=1